jgi:hypothetical protein
VSNSADSRPQKASDRGSAVRTGMLLVGVLVAGASLLHLLTLLMSQAYTQVEAGRPIVKASDKWIRLGVDTSSSQVPTALSQYEVIQPIEPKQTRPRYKDRGMQVTSRGSHGVHSREQSSSRPIRWSVASACPNVTNRGASDRHNSTCPSNRQHAVTFRVAKNQRQWSRPSAPT